MFLDVINRHTLTEPLALDEFFYGLFRHNLEGAIEIDDVVLHAEYSGKFLGLAHSPFISPCEIILLDPVEHITMNFWGADVKSPPV